MNKIILLIILSTLATFSFGQSNMTGKYFQADSLLKSHKIHDAYTLYKEIKPLVDIKDTLYKEVIWYYLVTISQLEKDAAMKEDYTNSLNYGLEALKLIQENKIYFDANFATREQWMVKNIIVSYFGLGQLNKAKEYKDILYKGYAEKTLPDGIDGYFNFDFFKLDDKNIWGYEWYPEIPSNRYSSSFTKVVYYVYSTNSDGTDKDQLYRLHVLMFHGEGEYDYLLERQYESDESTISGSYYQYRYKKDIDYMKLRKDIIEIVSKDIQPSSKRIVPHRK